MNATLFWEIVGLVLSLAQMLLYISGFNNYRSRLESLSDELTARAEARKAAYQTLRDKDPAFYSYYKGLPNYTPCQSNIERAKGAAFAHWGKQLRSSLRGINGYTQMQRVNVVGATADNAVFAPAMSRAMTQIAERRRIDDHVLQRWQAIVSAPTNPSHVADYSSIIQSSFSTMKSFGQGANSAGVTVGSLSYQIFG